mgnify:CR=1 FL=1
MAAWFGLWQARKPTGRSRWAAPSVAAARRVVTIALMASVANIGGEITHPEIMSQGEHRRPPSARWRQRLFEARRSACYQFHASERVARRSRRSTSSASVCCSASCWSATCASWASCGTLPTSTSTGCCRGRVGASSSTPVTGMLFFVGQAFQYIDNPAFPSEGPVHAAGWRQRPLPDDV